MGREVDCRPGVRFRFGDQIYTPGAQSITTITSMHDHGGMRRDHLNLRYELINYAVRIASGTAHLFIWRMETNPTKTLKLHLL